MISSLLILAYTLDSCSNLISDCVMLFGLHFVFVVLGYS